MGIEPTTEPTVEPTTEPTTEPTPEPTSCLECSVLNIDMMLTHCSAEFDDHDANIDALKSDVAVLKAQMQMILDFLPEAGARDVSVDAAAIHSDISKDTTHSSDGNDGEIDWIVIIGAVAVVVVMMTVGVALWMKKLNAKESTMSQSVAVAHSVPDLSVSEIPSMDGMENNNQSKTFSGSETA